MKKKENSIYGWKNSSLLDIIFIFLETRNRRSGIFQQFQRIHGRSSRYVRRYVYRAGSTAHRDTTNVISRVPIFFASFLPSLLSPSRESTPRYRSFHANMPSLFFRLFARTESEARRRRGDEREWRKLKR